ncbi:MAG: hypothetical protein ACR2J9_08125, partial [Gaiellales bacterium]
PNRTPQGKFGLGSDPKPNLIAARSCVALRCGAGGGTDGVEDALRLARVDGLRCAGEARGEVVGLAASR